MDYQMVNINLYTRVEGNQAFPKNNFQAAPDVKKFLQRVKYRFHSTRAHRLMHSLLNKIP